MGKYRIKAILHTGIDGERDTSRIDGRYPLRINRIIELDLKDVKGGKPFYLNYVTDENGNDYRGWRKRTSYVVDWDYAYDNVIWIETYRSIYELEEIEEK